MEQQIAALLQQNQELLKALQNKEAPEQKVNVQFEKFNDEIENFDSFLERFDTYLDVQKVPDALRPKVFISSLNPKLYQLLKNLLAPEIPSDQSLDSLKDVLRKHLNPKPLIIPSRHKFLNRKQHEGESINNYIAELRALALNCDYDRNMLNVMLRDVFVSGLKDKTILDRLFEEDNIDLDKTLQIAVAMEKACKGANDVMGKGINALQVGKKNKLNYKKQSFPDRYKKDVCTEEFCTRCTGTDHRKQNCKFISSRCNYCSRIGHIKKACFFAKKANSKPVKQKQVNINEDIENKNEVNINGDIENKNEVPLYEFRADEHILQEEEPKQPPIMISLKIENKNCSMELDTGGAVSVMSIRNFRKISNKKIQPTNIIFRTYKGDSLIPMGYVTVKVEYKNQNLTLNLYIVKENLDTIFGREWLHKINLDWYDLKAVRTSSKGNLNKLLEEYKELFDNKMGKIKNFEIQLKLKQGVKPIFRRFRNVPFALKERVENEIERLEREGIIERVESSEWATPVVPVVKSDGSIRLCADFSVTLNPNLVVPQHPLPKLEEIFSSLNGGKQFSKLDFKHAYLQMGVHPESQKLLTINTHKGLYNCKRLMYGLNGAPAIWQRYVDGLFQGMEGIKVFMDDARITGVDETSHLRALEQFFKKCKEHGLKLNLSKSKFFQNEINFLGHKIDANGLHKTDDKIAAILNAPVPKDIQEVKSFLGLVNFYGKFCYNLATMANPLNNLTKKDTKFIWSRNCQEAFEKIKKEICSPKVLVHYDPNLPLTLATDASPVGVGTVLSHVYPDGTERPIAFASRTLTNTEKNYAQIDKEALAIIWAVQKFYMYLKGRRFSLITDHKPLVAIFGSKRGLPVLTATRLLHYALILQSFEFDIKYRDTKNHGNADFLSRLPTKSEELDVKDDISMRQMTQIETLPVTSKELSNATGKDLELGPLLQALREGQNLQGREAQYTIEDGCIMYGQRVCVPLIYQKRVLEELHQGHLGMVKMKAIARSFVFWKNIDQDIEEAAKNCAECAKYKADPTRVKTHHWEYPSKPWERIHIDFAGPIFEYTFLIIVDAHSKWLEVYPMKSTTSYKTIDCLRDCFSRFGLPIVLVSDNGSQFTSYEFQKFMLANGIKHKTCAPFKPSSNGQAERYVYTVKQALRTMQKYEGSVTQKLSTFLLQYRKAPNATTSHSPAMLFLKRDIRTRIDLLLPDLKSRVQERVRKGVYEFQDRKFNVGDHVAVRDYRAANSKWKFGDIINQDGALHYTVNVQGTLVRRHVDQIRPVGDKVQDSDQSSYSHHWIPSNFVKETTPKPQVEHDPIPEVIAGDLNSQAPSTVASPSKTLPGKTSEQQTVFPTNNGDTAVAQQKPTTMPRRSGRIRKAPQRLNL